MHVEPNELRHIVWDQLGQRPPATATSDDMHAYLSYKQDVEEEHEVNEMRKELVGFIKANETRLSLPCHGNCHLHTDLVVIHCYMQYLEDQSATADQETTEDTE